MRRSHQREWNQIFQNLKTLFRSAVDEAHRRGLVHAEFKKKFYISGKHYFPMYQSRNVIFIPDLL